MASGKISAKQQEILDYITGGIFFHQIFHRTHGHPAILEGEEKGVLVAIHGGMWL